MTKIFLIILVLILGFWLRADNYAVWPRHGATFDEFAWSWLGINLIQKGVPISWSRHPQYKSEEFLLYQGASFRIVRPYLEHPPLFGLAIGSFALLNGVSDMYHVTLKKIRPFALILGLLSVLMIFFLTQELYGKKIAFLSALLYATIPTVVVGSRIVQNENFLIPFWLASLYLATRYLKTNKIIFRNLAIIIGGLLPLAKAPWLVVAFSLLMIFAYKGRWRDFFVTIIVTSILFSSFFIYGIYFDKEVFFGLWRLQLSRYDMSFVGLFSIFRYPLLVDRYYLDGWIYFGFISLFLISQEFKKHIFVILPFLAYLLVFIFVIPDEPGHGWYRYPFYPFLIISIALFLREYFITNRILTFLFLTFVGLTLFQLTWVVYFGFSYLVLRIIIVSLTLTLFPIFFASKKLKQLINKVSYAWFILLIFLNIWVVMLYNEQ